MTLRSLQHLFEPERILWVGPVGQTAPWAGVAERNLFDTGFQGQLHALNSTGAAPEEQRLGDLDEYRAGPCLAVVCLPQADLPALIDALGAKGCRAAFLLGGGKAPYDLDHDTCRAVLHAARRHEQRLIGPDRVGVIVPKLSLNAGSSTTLPLSGYLALLTQSDSLATSLLEWAGARHIGFSRIVSAGDGPDVELGDLIDYLALDSITRAILIHVEAIADARRFMSAARAAARIKPVVAIKAGRRVELGTDQQGESRRLQDQVHDAAFARAGIVRVETMEELFAAAASLGVANLRRSTGIRAGRLAILTNGQAPAGLAADTLLAGGGRLATDGKAAPDHAGSLLVHDLGLEADAEAYTQALAELRKAPQVDGILAIHAPAPGIDPAAVAASITAGAGAARSSAGPRPLFAAFLGDASFQTARPVLERALVPVFAEPEPAVRAFLHRVQHERRQHLLQQIPSTRPDPFEPRRDAAQAILDQVLAAGRQELTEPEAMALLDAYGMASVATRIVRDLGEAAEAAQALGYPIALKIVSADLPQKSAAGGVALDIENEASLRRRGRELLARVARLAPAATIEGLVVQRMERSLFPTELRLGMLLDPAFGPVLCVGPTTAGDNGMHLLPPLDATLAQALLAETTLGRALEEAGRTSAATLDLLVTALVRLSQLVVDLPAVASVSIDPLLLTSERAVVLDAHVGLLPVPRGTEPTARLAVRPYPRELERLEVLKNGLAVRLRPIRPEDASAIQRGFKHMDREDARRRLFTTVRELSDELVGRLTQIDYDREMALVVPDPDRPDELWAGARISAEPDMRRAEFAITVRSDKQGLGLGRLCLQRVLDYAQTRGIEEVWGSVLAENDGMLALAERLGFTRRRDPDDPELFKVIKRFDAAAS